MHVRAVIQQFSQAKIPYLQEIIDWLFDAFRTCGPHQQARYLQPYCAIVWSWFPSWADPKPIDHCSLPTCTFESLPSSTSLCSPIPSSLKLIHRNCLLCCDILIFLTLGIDCLWQERPLRCWGCSNVTFPSIERFVTHLLLFCWDLLEALLWVSQQFAAQETI